MERHASETERTSASPAEGAGFRAGRRAGGDGFPPQRHSTPSSRPEESWAASRIPPAWGLCRKPAPTALRTQHAAGFLLADFSGGQQRHGPPGPHRVPAHHSHEDHRGAGAGQPEEEPGGALQNAAQQGGSPRPHQEHPQHHKGEQGGNQYRKAYLNPPGSPGGRLLRPKGKGQPRPQRNRQQNRLPPKSGLYVSFPLHFTPPLPKPFPFHYMPVRPHT